MKAKKVLVTIIATCMIVSGVIASPMAAGRVAFAENTDAKAAVEQGAETGENQEAKEPELTEEQKAAKEREEARLALRNDPNHVHKYEWIAQMNESESADGTLNYMCPECGKVWFFRTIPAYRAFSGDVAHRIETAPEGETVKVKTSLFISFNSEVMEALEERSDVSLCVSFLDQEYKGNRVSFTIPAGEDTMSLLDENGYVGFIFLGGKYGLKMEVPMEGSADTQEQADTEEHADDASGDVQTTTTETSKDNS